MNENKKEKSIQKCEKDFKDKMFKALSQKNPGVHMDQDGFIVMPVKVRRKPKNN